LSPAVQCQFPTVSCTTSYAIESGSVERAARDAGYRFLRIDTDYSMNDIGQLQTRIEAFLEMLGEGKG